MRILQVIFFISIWAVLFVSCNTSGTIDAPVGTSFKIDGAKEEVIKKFPDGKTQLSVFKDEKTNEKLAEIEFHPDGKTYLEKHFKGEKLNGESYSYYVDGKRWSLNTYKDGQYHGPWKAWWPNGSIRLEGKYENGIATGEWFFYHDNGKIDTRGFYNKGVKTGVWTSYNPEGTLVREVNYSLNDKP